MGMESAGIEVSACLSKGAWAGQKLMDLTRYLAVKFKNV